MRSLDQSIIFHALDGEFYSEAETFQVRIGGVTEKDGGVDLGLVDDFLLACARADELEGAKEASYSPDASVLGHGSAEAGVTHRRIP